jgi:hypothetical protein
MRECEPFDIRDTRNVYQPCPRCRVTLGLGLMLGNRNATIAVQCMNCDFRGPEVPAVLDSLMTMDRQAFETWNDMNRIITTPWSPEHVEALQVIQSCPRWHTYTCEHHSDVPLRATPEGWRCDVPNCGYTQAWAWAPPAGRSPHTCTACGMGGAWHCMHCTRCV